MGLAFPQLRHRGVTPSRSRPSRAGPRALSRTRAALPWQAGAARTFSGLGREGTARQFVQRYRPVTRPIIRAMKILVAALLLAVACASPEGAQVQVQAEPTRPERHHATYHLENVDATTVVLPLLESLSAFIEEDGPVACFQVDQRTNSILLIALDPAKLQEMLALVSAMDCPQSKRQ
jgi:hypothetical protein